MGSPKKQRKKYEKPKRPWDKERLEREKKLKTEYGLKRKKEILRAESILRNFRRRARALQAEHNEEKAKELLKKVNKIGLNCQKIEDVLTIKLEDILSRRLQSIIRKKAISNSMGEARQLIIHGHILINSRKMLWPGYLVPTELENKIELKTKMKEKVQDAAKGVLE
jgi:small subunit ribosomal protein S4